MLVEWGLGDPAAFEQLAPYVYDELKRIARRYMAGERAGHTLEATALVNEAYIRLIDISRVKWQNRAHFFAISARLMRRILVDAARSKHYQKRGGADAQRIELEEALLVSEPRRDLLALDDALQALTKFDPRKAQVVELRYFGGLSLDEIAESLKVSPATVMRDWKLAKAWLRRELAADDAPKTTETRKRNMTE